MLGHSARSNARAPGESSVLNEKRPSNPFTPTTEPDWKTKSTPVRAKSRTTTLRDPQSAQPRFNGTQALSSKADQDTKEQEAAAKAPILRTPSVVSTLSTTSSVTRKPAPPVPRKPPLLTRPSDQQPKPPQGTAKSAIKPTPVLTPVDDGPPLPPRRTRAEVRNTKGLMDEDDDSLDRAGSIPSLQPTRKT